MWISSGKGDRVVDTYQTLNDVLVNLFRDIMDLEQKAIITDEFKDISNNDMHIIDAIGEDGCKSMSTVAKALSVTVGTLTIAINSLVKKGYVSRERSEEDRRVVLLSLSEKGKRAFLHHKKFHDAMIRKVLEGLNEQETEVLVKALQNLRGFFYGL
ncbi:MarR family transcriptional regulator [Lachnospiraceae bacterium ASD3451]|uniref:MarR family transcriptional regulator n=1 Tax=Diplocloster agilis TaxID=2850323 RepID=A0A949JX14_9FIRM|nr:MULTISPECIES: MarR family transcriptional regulator [Lachnospiraceae]MBU9736745.1 MarR family transcriptional regulator [Diplocloster agilis]MBU9743565.1 MarR family transcriptional regulator [Diplocloster agilis]MCU6736018.1 MarR family transcriptional regulator [Suonthocola fibrivorans]